MPGKRYSRIIPVSGIPIEAGNMKPRAKKTIVTTTLSIRVTGGLNSNVNGMISWVIQQNNAKKCLPLISLQIVQLLPNPKITSG
jgi:hypothetical protein